MTLRRKGLARVYTTKKKPRLNLTHIHFSQKEFALILQTIRWNQTRANIIASLNAQWPRRGTPIVNPADAKRMAVPNAKLYLTVN